MGAGVRSERVNEFTIALVCLMVGIFLIGIMCLLCACTAMQDRQTGSLRCVGACELIIDHQETEIKTEEPDGSSTTEKTRTTGMAEREQVQ